MSKRTKNFVLIGVLLVAAGLAAALIAVSVTGANDDAAAPTALHGVADTEAMLKGIPQKGNVLGNPDAPVTIVEYADYQCPFCAQWAATRCRRSWTSTCGRARRRSSSRASPYSVTTR